MSSWPCFSSLAIVLVALACTPAEPPSPPAAATTTVREAAPPVAPSPAPAAAPAVLVTRAGVAFEGARVVPIEGDPALGADAKYKRSGPNDLYLVPLATAFAKAQSEGRLARGTDRVKAELTVVVDPDVPYRLVIEVLFTAGQNDLGRYLLHEGAGSSRTAVTEPPSMARPTLDAAPEPKLNLSVWVVQAGISVKTWTGNVAPGCRGVGAGVAIPLADGKHDFAALAACVARVRSDHPQFAAERSFVLTADAGTPFREVMSAVEAMRGPADRPLFPTVYFGVAR